MAYAQDKRHRLVNTNVRNRIAKSFLPRGYIVESDESEILLPDYFKSLHPLNPSAAKQAEKEYIAERWKRYPGKVYDMRERPILIDSVKEHHREIGRKRRDEFNAKWQLYLERQEEEKRLQKQRAVPRKTAKETLRICKQCNNFAHIAVDGGICSECVHSNRRIQPGRSQIPLPQTAAQRRRRYQSRIPVYPSAIPLPPTAAHKRRKYQEFHNRVYPSVRTFPSVPLAITEREPYSFDIANFPQDLESFPLQLPEQEVDYHDQDWRYAVGTMEDLDKISQYFLSKSYMPVYNEADFKD